MAEKLSSCHPLSKLSDSLNFLKRQKIQEIIIFSYTKYSITKEKCILITKCWYFNIWSLDHEVCLSMRIGVRVVNATFNNILVISFRSVLLVEQTRYPEKTTNLPHVIDKLHYIMLYRVHLAWAGFELTTLVVLGIDCMGSCKSNYYMITTALLTIEDLMATMLWRTTI